ncbi:unnamed protein product [Amoebophrya sp. A25]|nr:unnamed protein product [Amoebophrya sp. A25]|eukprot:GSA25T00003647001.1
MGRPKPNHTHRYSRVPGCLVRRHDNGLQMLSLLPQAFDYWLEQVKKEARAEMKITCASIGIAESTNAATTSNTNDIPTTTTSTTSSSTTGPTSSSSNSANPTRPKIESLRIFYPPMQTVQGKKKKKGSHFLRKGDKICEVHLNGEKFVLKSPIQGKVVECNERVGEIMASRKKDVEAICGAVDRDIVDAHANAIANKSSSGGGSTNTRVANDKNEIDCTTKVASKNVDAIDRLTTALIEEYLIIVEPRSKDDEVFFWQLEREEPALKTSLNATEKI